MFCPKCDEGVVSKIRFKKTGFMAYLCDVCGALWAEGQGINFNTGSTYEAYENMHGSEYSIEEFPEVDFEHQSPRYAHYK